MDISEMTGKQIYDETKRLKAERELRRELRMQEYADKEDENTDREEMMFSLGCRFVIALEALVERIPAPEKPTT